MKIKSLSDAGSTTQETAMGEKSQFLTHIGHNSPSKWSSTGMDYEL